MALDYVVAFAAGIAQLVTSWLGYRVSAHPIPPEDKRRHKIYETSFVIMGIIGAVTIVYNGISLSKTLYEIQNTQGKTNTGISQIQENMKHPPVITVNPPPIPIPPQRAYIRMGRLGLSQYQIGSDIRVNNECENVTDIPAQTVQCLHELLVVDTQPLGIHGEPAVPKETQIEKTNEFDRDLAKLKKESSITYGPHEQRFGTDYGPVLDSELDNKLRNGGKALLFIAAYRWKDKAGTHKNEICTWLQWHFDQKETWHDCEVHTGLRY